MPISTRRPSRRASSRDKADREESLRQRYDFDFHFHEPEQVEAAFAGAGLEVERVVERDPYPGIEVETKRFYVLATNPAGPDHSEEAA